MGRGGEKGERKKQVESEKQSPDPGRKSIWCQGARGEGESERCEVLRRRPLSDMRASVCSQWAHHNSFSKKDGDGALGLQGNSESNMHFPPPLSDV